MSGFTKAELLDQNNKLRLSLAELETTNKELRAIARSHSEAVSSMLDRGEDIRVLVKALAIVIKHTQE